MNIACVNCNHYECFDCPIAIAKTETIVTFGHDAQEEHYCFKCEMIRKSDNWSIYGEGDYVCGFCSGAEDNVAE